MQFKPTSSPPDTASSARNRRHQRRGATAPRGLSVGRSVGVFVGTMAAVTVLSSGTSGARPNHKPAPHAAKAQKESADGLTLLDTNSLQQAMRKAKGSDLFIHLWASWCGPCMEELADIDRLALQTRARGAAFLSVSLDDPKRAEHVLKVLHRQAPNLTRFVAKLDDPDKFAELFAGEWDGSIPALFVYDRTGHLRASFVGQLENADIRRMLADISVAPPGAPAP
jgi:thiol-disulfide isomerase/thioredoxin